MENAKQEPTYLTVRCADRQPKNEGGKTGKNVQTFFYNGGNDKRGLPIFNADKKVAFVGEKSGRIHIYDIEGGELARVDGVVQKPTHSFAISKFIEGTKKGLTSKTLEVGQGVVTGPKGNDLIKRLEAINDKALAAREAAKAEKAKASPAEDAKPARRKP